MNTIGNQFKVTIFGESHGPAVGVVVDGVPPGLVLDTVRIGRDLARRAPGRSELATARQEADETEIVSGVKDGVATGAPITCLIWNLDVRSEDYPETLRPGQADWTALLKYKGYDDRRGGGRFSGRLTAGLVFAGALAKQILAEKGVRIYGRVKAVGGEADRIDLTGSGSQDRGFRDVLSMIADKDFPCAAEVEDVFRETILLAKEEQDSVGGIVEAVAFGVPAGIGEPFFDSVESRVAQLLFSVPAVKGVEFGLGFALADMLGSEANDPLAVQGGQIVSITNASGGVLGGIANGMPLIVRAAVKPTASIGVAQRTVNPRTLTEESLALGGRHDPCIAPRAVPVVEACVAMALLDLAKEGGIL